VSYRWLGQLHDYAKDHAIAPTTTSINSAIPFISIEIGINIVIAPMSTPTPSIKNLSDHISNTGINEDWLSISFICVLVVSIDIDVIKDINANANIPVKTTFIFIPQHHLLPPMNKTSLKTKYIKQNQERAKPLNNLSEIDTILHNQPLYDSFRVKKKHPYTSPCHILASSKKVGCEAKDAFSISNANLNILSKSNATIVYNNDGILVFEHENRIFMTSWDADSQFSKFKYLVIFFVESASLLFKNHFFGDNFENEVINECWEFTQQKPQLCDSQHPIFFKNQSYIIYLGMKNMIIMGGIDLSKVPKDRINKIAEEKNIDLSNIKNLSEKRNKLNNEIDRQILEELTSDYIYAGKTSMLWYTITPENKTTKPFNKENINEILTFLCDDENPFEIERKPELSRVPQIIKAHFKDDGNAFVLFAAKGRAREIFDGYSTIMVSPTQWINVLFRLNDNIIEVRSKINIGKTTINNLVFDLSTDSRYKHSIRFLNLTENILIELKEHLDAKMTDYIGKDDEDFAWRGYGVRDNEDIWEMDKFQSVKQGLFSPKTRLIFPSVNDSDYYVKLRASTITGGITFQNQYVSEQDINLVYEKLKTINAFGD